MPHCDTPAKAVACAYNLKNPLASRIAAGWQDPGILRWPITVFAATKNTLKTVAAVVWFSGAMVLMLKSASLLLEAMALRPGEPWSWLAVAAGLLIGGAKAQWLFGGFCRKNLDRIAALREPKLWQAFRTGFYVFLVTMVMLGATLSNLATENYAALLALVVLDLSIAIALLGSIREFWQQQ